MNRRQFLRQAIAIVSVVCLVACAKSTSTKLDPALDGYSKENLTLSLTDLEISVLEPGTSDPRTEQVTWTDGSTLEIRTYTTLMNPCGEWIDVGYQLVAHWIIVKTIVGDWVSKDGVYGEKCGRSIYEVRVIISELPTKDYQIQLRSGEAMEPRIHPRW